MFSLKFVRENFAALEEGLKKRNEPRASSYLKELLEFDVDYRRALQESEALKAEKNKLTQQIVQLRQSKKGAEAQIKLAKGIDKRLATLEANVKGLLDKINSKLPCIPNILHESVPLGRDETQNVEVRRWGKLLKPSFKLLHHGQLAEQTGLADFERAAKVSGKGFYFLKGDLALLDIALQRFGIDLLLKKGFTLVGSPLMLWRKPYEGVTSLEDFENVMYKVDSEASYLIATSEHPMVAMHMGETLPEEKLPIRYVGSSPCFRREIGRHKIDERGLFRVHQFNKVEQVVLCGPEDSWKIFEELISNAEELMQKLELPYRIVEVCTGDIGVVAAKKLDLEGWSAREQKFIEVVSCSNCTFYQSVGLNIKHLKKNGEKGFVHTLNSTQVATARVLRLILENFQTRNGRVKVPRALQPLMGGLKELRPINE